MLHYYATRYFIQGGECKTPVVKYGTEADMLYQYYLFCASSSKNADGHDMDACVFGTIEGGVIERRLFDHTEA